jgi:ketosteroid isomerase-like protein
MENRSRKEAVRRMVERAELHAWVTAYERLWRTPGTAGLSELFTEDATYSQEPYAEPVRGLPAIREMWERQREGPDEPFELTFEIIAVDGAVGIVRAEVHYLDGGNEYRDLWVVTADDDGRCTSFEEWPFWPTKGYHP